MKPSLKHAVWATLGFTVLAALAIPKMLPLLQKDADAKPVARVAAAGVNTPAASASSKNQARNNQTGSNQAGRADTRAPLQVSTITVARAPFAEILNSTGSLRAEESVELQAEINGKVVAINFTEGAHVQQGALLVKLNDADLRATRQRALQRKQLATLREQRLSKLVKDGVVRQEEYDVAWNELQVQNAEIDLADAQIAKTEIRAPFSGVVGLRYVSEGAFVNAATRVATLQRLDQLKIDFSIPEKYAGRIRPGMPIVFAVAGGEGKFNGRIYAFDPRIDAATRSVLLRALVPNPEGRLLPGAFANVELTLTQMNDAILIPAVAVIPGLTEKNVFVMSEGKAQRRAVETGTRTASQVHILSGLKPGDVVITSGLQQMREGLPVSPVSSDLPVVNADVAGAHANAVVDKAVHST
jgi:membrane fusion protein (multidrug efflux system)